MTSWWAYQVARHSENLENFCESIEQINFLVIQNLFETTHHRFVGSLCNNLFQIKGKGVRKT